MARDPKKTDSVYDFLYVDARRISVLLSQLGNGVDGVLTEQKRQTTNSSQNAGGLNIQVAKIDHQEGESMGLTRTFDPQWLQPLRFLDLASELIVRDLDSARLGQMVLARGTVSFHDYTMLMAILAHPAMRKRIAKSEKIDWQTAVTTIGLTDEESKNMTPAKRQKAREEAAELLLSVIDSMPKRSQMVVSGSHGRTWSLLRDDSMIVSCDELAITHGSSIPGEWIVVGLLDGRAEVPIAEEQAGDTALIGALLPGDGPQPPAQAFMNSTNAMSKVVKTAVGRPDGTFAITPLMIFREIPAI